MYCQLFLLISYPVCSVVPGEILEPVRQSLSFLRRFLPVDPVFLHPAGGVEDGKGPGGLPLGLHIGGALPAAELENFVHQEAGGEIRAFSHKVMAQSLLGGRVGPDGVPGGVVVQEPFGGGGVQGDPQGLVGTTEKICYTTVTVW